MEIRLIEEADKDLLYWQKSNNSKILKRISELFTAIEENPLKGIGKPKALKYKLFRILVKTY